VVQRRRREKKKNIGNTQNVRSSGEGGEISVGTFGEACQSDGLLQKGGRGKTAHRLGKWGICQIYWDRIVTFLENIKGGEKGT